LYEITKVTFNELSDEAIHYYIDNYKPYGSLWDTGMDWFYSRFKIEGSYANVGMPVDKVYDYLIT
jgi:septum formation protein